uniref:COP9 signalosome subunit 7A n=1 Tax=Oryctolagus cuniculus TaxID=9986 RepID=A0A5F9D163_RABIT
SFIETEQKKRLPSFFPRQPIQRAGSRRPAGRGGARLLRHLRRRSGSTAGSRPSSSVARAALQGGGRKGLEQLPEVTERRPRPVRWKTKLPGSGPQSLAQGTTGQSAGAHGPWAASLREEVEPRLAESDFASTFRLLTVFAYGTYADYLAEARNLPPLTEAQKNKLRHLSVVTLAAKVKCIPYAVLLEALALRNVRQLEDLVIEAVYADVLRGSLDQRNQRLEVDYSIGRDIQRQDLSAIARTLQEWCVGCEVVLSGIEEQVSRANQHKEQQLGLKQQIESEVANLKKTIKVTTAAAAAATSQDPEQHLTELREPAAGTNQRQPSKKASKGKGLRGSAKIWSKSN